MKTTSAIIVLVLLGRMAVTVPAAENLPEKSPPLIPRADGGFSVGVIDAMEVDRLPVVKSRTAPTYPIAMRRAGVTGRVVVQFTVDTDGSVRDVTAVESTRPEFETAALDAVSQWTFSPGIKNNRAVKTRLRVPIVFSLNPNPPARN